VWNRELLTYLDAQQKTSPGTSDSAVSSALNLTAAKSFPLQKTRVRAQSTKHALAVVQGLAAAMSADMRDPRVTDVKADGKGVCTDGDDTIAQNIATGTHEKNNPTDNLQYMDSLADR
jgi:hypothetical protein